MTLTSTCSPKTLEGIIRGTNFRVSGLAPGMEGLVQRFQLQFARQLERIYDLTSDSFYYVEGNAEGQIQFTKIIGPKGGPKLTCDCIPRTIILNASNTLCYKAGSTGTTGSTAESSTPNRIGTDVLASYFSDQTQQIASAGLPTSNGSVGSNTPDQDLSYTLLNALPNQLSGQGDVSSYLLVFSISYMFSDLQ